MALVGYPANLIKELKIILPDPSDTFTKRKMEIDEQKARVVQAVVGLGIFPKSTIYKEFYDMTDEEIEHLQTELEKEQEEQVQKEIQQQADAAAAGAPQDQQTKDQDMERDQAGKDMDMARSEGEKQSDFDREKELQKMKPSSKKEEVDIRLINTLHKVKQKIIQENTGNRERLASIDRVITRNIKKRQKNS